jgi:hypothetical protein
MKTTTSVILAVFAGVLFQNRIAQAQFIAANEPYRVNNKAISQQQHFDSTSIAGPAFVTQPEKFHLGLRIEGGEANASNFQCDLGFDIGMGDWIIQGDYRSYGGQARPNNTPPSAWDVLLIGWVPSGSPISTPISQLPNTLDGINEYSLTTGKVLRALHGTFVLMPTIGLAAVSREIVHYSNCAQVAQPGTGLIFIIPFSDTETYYQYNATVEPEVSITVPISLHAILEFSSWIGLSFSGWTEIGNGGTSGWSAGVEIGALP